MDGIFIHFYTFLRFFDELEPYLMRLERQALKVEIVTKLLDIDFKNYCQLTGFFENILSSSKRLIGI